jgi:hypothetical protein
MLLGAGVAWQVDAWHVLKLVMMPCTYVVFAGLGSGLFFIGYSFAMIPSQYILMQVRPVACCLSSG